MEKGRESALVLKASDVLNLLIVLMGELYTTSDRYCCFSKQEFEELHQDG